MIHELFSNERERAFGVRQCEGKNKGTSGNKLSERGAHRERA